VDGAVEALLRHGPLIVLIFESAVALASYGAVKYAIPQATHTRAGGREPAPAGVLGRDRKPTVNRASEVSS